MYLKSDASLSGTDFFVPDIYHFFSIEPGLYVISLYSDPQGIPIPVFQDIFFFIRDLYRPSAAVRFIYTSGIEARRSNFYLPSVHFHIFLHERTDENTGVSVRFLFEFDSKVEIVIIFSGGQVAVLFIGATFTY